MTLTIILIVVGILVLIGATQRKKLALIFKSEANAVIKKVTNPVKIMELKLAELKASIGKMVDVAASLYAQILKLEKDLGKFIQERDEYLKAAKKAKEEDNENLAKSKLEAKLYTDKLINQTKSDIATLSEKKTALEIKINKLKLKQSMYKNDIETLKSRSDINKALKSITGLDSIDGESLDETIESFTETVDMDENKIAYTSTDAEEDFSTEVDSEFEKL